jgi:hypothetical protein
MTVMKDISKMKTTSSSLSLNDGTFLICQQPDIGRMQGLRQKELRLLSPALILKLQLPEEYTYQQLEAFSAGMICRVNLYKHITECNADYLDMKKSPESKKVLESLAMPNLEGGLIEPARLLWATEDHTKRKDIFFIFSRLSIRAVGDYYFKCTLIDMKEYFKSFFN